MDYDCYGNSKKGVVTITSNKSMTGINVALGKLFSFIGITKKYGMVTDTMYLVYKLSSRRGMLNEEDRRLKIFKADGRIIDLSGEEITERFGAMTIFQICGKGVIIGINGAGYYLIGKDGKAIDSSTFSYNGEGIPHFRDILHSLLPCERQTE